MEKIWLASYPAGMPADIALDDLTSLGEFLAQSVAKFGARDAFVSGAAGTAITFNELDTLSARFASYLQSLGLKPGTRIALMMPNLLQFPVCLFGALRAGCVVVNVNPMYTARELAYQLQDSGAEAIVILENFAHVLSAADKPACLKHIIVSSAGDLLPFALRTLASVVMRAKGLIPPYKLNVTARLRTVLRDTALPAPAPVHVKASDLAFLQYTGGTTGVSKGAMLSHLNVLANSRQGQIWTLPALDTSKAQISITAIPLYHIFALGMMMNTVAFGGTTVLVADPRNTKAFVKVLSKYRFATLPAVNTLYNDLLNHPDFAKVDFSSLRVAFGGGASIQRSVAERWQKLTGSPICEGYGLTECSPTVTANPVDFREFNGSIGLPFPSTDVSLRDENDNEVALGEPGELCVRGPQVMSGYWQKPEETAKVMTPDGFLRTGDIATIDAQGFLRIVDRLKDMIIVSGFNVYPNEVEDIIAMHTGVLEVAVIGVNDEHTGEAVKACVVRKDPALTEQDLLAHCRTALTGYKRPRHIQFVDELPKSPVGKILRRQLREAQTTTAH